MNRPFFTVCLTISLSLSTWATGNNTGYTIETIRVMGARHTSTQIVLSTSLLQEGHSYTVKELEHAVRRVNRLPYVLDTSYRLEPGSRGDTYTLIIDIRDASLFFTDIATEWIEFEDSDNFSIDTLEVGARWFVGASGLFTISADPDLTWSQDFDKVAQYKIDYTHANFLGKNIAAGIELDYREDGVFRGGPFTLEEDSILTPSIFAYIPLGGNHWLKSRLSYSEQERRTFVIDPTQHDNESFSSNETVRLRTFWEYNTLDSDFFPKNGRKIDAGIELESSRNLFSSNNFVFGEGSIKTDRDAYFVISSYQKYRTFRNRHTLSYRAQLAYIHRVSDFRSPSPEILGGNGSEDSSSLALEGFYSYDLFGGSRSTRKNDLRLLFGANAGYFKEDGGTVDDDGTTYAVIAALAYRNRWGKISLSFQYVNFD